MLTAHWPGEGEQQLSTSLSVNARKAAERMVARLFGEGGKLILGFISVTDLTCCDRT
jgi:hypothetical protein